MRRTNYLYGTTSGCNMYTWNKISVLCIFSSKRADTLQIFSAVLLSSFSYMSHNNK